MVADRRVSATPAVVEARGEQPVEEEGEERGGGEERSEAARVRGARDAQARREGQDRDGRADKRVGGTEPDAGAGEVSYVAVREAGHPHELQMDEEPDGGGDHREHERGGARRPGGRGMRVRGIGGSVGGGGPHVHASFCIISAMKNHTLILRALLLAWLLALLAAAPPAVATDDARVLFLVLDGVRQRSFDELLAKGDLPHLAALAARGTLIERAVGAFPSTTGPAYAPFVTGCLTGKAGVPGIRWYDRDRELYRVYCGTDTGAFDADLNPDVKTVYELLPPDDALAVFGFIERGCRHKTTPFLSLAVPKLTGNFHAMDRALFDTFWSAYRERGFPRYAFVSLHAPDSVGHAAGPDDPAYADSIRYLDGLVGELVARLKGEGLFAATTFIITSDHGQQGTDRGMDTRAELERLFGMKVYNSVPRVSQTFNLKRRLGMADFDAIFAVSGNAFVMVYLKDPASPDMKARPSYATLRAYPCPDGRTRDLPAALLELPAVRAVFLKEAEGRVRCVGRDGEAAIVAEGGLLRYDLLAGADPLGYGALAVHGRAMDPAEWLRATSRAELPDGPVQIDSLFRARGTGDLVFIASPGHEPWNEGQKGVHGSLDADQNLVPALVSGPDVKVGRHGEARTADLFPLTCRLLGLPVPEGIDGRDLPILKDRAAEPPLAREAGVVAMSIARIEEKALLTEMAAEKARHDRTLFRLVRAESPRYKELRARLNNLWQLRRRVDAGSARAAAALLAMPLYADGTTPAARKATLEALAAKGRPTGLLSRIARAFAAPLGLNKGEAAAAALVERAKVDAACLGELARLDSALLAELLDGGTLDLIASLAPPPGAAAARSGIMPAPSVDEPPELAVAAEAAPLGAAGKAAYDRYAAAYARVRALADAGRTDDEALKPALDELSRAKGALDALREKAAE